MRHWLCFLFLVSLAFAPTVHAKPTDADKAKTEKKLDSFEKTYDPSKDLSRKNPDKLDKDVEELDTLLAELKALDPAAFAELSARRYAVVSQAKQGVSTASAGKSDEVFNKHFAKLQESFDPEKKRLKN
jgi:hypothetical protein